MNSDIKMAMIPLPIVLGTSAVLMIIRGIAFRLLHRCCEKTESRIDNIMLQALRTPSIYWCLAIGLYIGLAVSNIPPKYILIIDKTIHVILILSISIAAANLTGNIFTEGGSRLAPPTECQ